MKRAFQTAALALSLLTIPGCAKAPDFQLLSQNGYQLCGSFVAGGVPPGTQWPRGEGVQFHLGSWPENKMQPGTFVSADFVAPANIVVFLSGHPTPPGNRLYLEDLGRKLQLTLAVRNDPGPTWQRYVWEIPPQWRGHTVHLVAEHRAPDFDAWFALTLPRGITASAKMRVSLSRMPVFLLIIVLEGLGFLLPGLAVAFLLEWKYAFDEVQFICLCLVGSGASGYLVFWLYLANATAGKAVSLLILSASLVIVVYMAKIRGRQTHIYHLAFFAALMLLVTTFYTAVGFLYERSEEALTQAQLRFVHALPNDNAVPYYFADKLYHGDPVRPFLVGDWKSSDRPPLQTGIALMEFPMWSFRTRARDYQILGTFLQSMWVVPLWGLASTLSLPRRTIIVVLAFCVFSGFFLLHTFYVWPKLLAASYFLLALLVIGYARGNIRGLSPVNAALAGAALGLALLSHGGVIFSILALGIVLLARRELPPARSLLCGLLLLSLFLLPWVMYQKFYDPPGDRLLKWHLAGVRDLDSRPFRQLLIDAYSKPPASAIIGYKLQNFRSLFGPSPWPILRSVANRGSWTRLLAWYKGGIFFDFFQTLGILNLGLLAFLWARIFRNKAGPHDIFCWLPRLLSLPAVSLAVWCLIMYLPGSTLVHQGSLADVMLVFLALGLSLAVLWPRWTYVVLAAQVFVLFPVFALSDMFPASPPNTIWANGLDLGMACLSLLSLLGLVILAWKRPRSSTIREQPRVAAER